MLDNYKVWFQCWEFIHFNFISKCKEKDFIGFNSRILLKLNNDFFTDLYEDFIKFTIS